MTNAQDVADYLIIRASAAGNPVDQLKLQKLVYYAQAYHLAAFAEPLFADTVEAWRYGPAVRSVYSRFRSYGRTPIESQASQTPSLEAAARDWLDQVWSAFGGFSGPELANRTHGEAPYREAYDRRTSERSHEVIENDSMRDYYLDCYEEWQPGYVASMSAAYESVDSGRVASTACTFPVSLRAVYDC